MPHKCSVAMIAIFISGSTAAQGLLVNSCNQQQQGGESACRTQNNKHLSHLSECQIRVNRDYANCVYRSSRF